MTNISGLSLRDREYDKFVTDPSTGSTAVRVYGDVNAIISGNIIIGSVSANVDSIYIQSGDNINVYVKSGDNVNLGSAWTNIGSVLITNGATVGSIATQTVIGSFAITNIGSVIQSTNPWIILGSIATTNTGSVIIANSLVSVSGIAFNISRQAVATNRYTASSGASTQLSGLAIPNGYDVTIKALNTNVTQIGVGSQTTFNVGSLFNLYPNESIKLGVDNTNRIFFMTQTTNDGLEIITEI